MSVSVVGFVLGSWTSAAVVARQGGVESGAKEYSDRNAPTCVAINDETRGCGHEAKPHQRSKVKGIICESHRPVRKIMND